MTHTHTHSHKHEEELSDEDRVGMLHFQVQCLYCDRSLLARTNKLTQLVILVQLHFWLVHETELSGIQVLSRPDLQWSVSEGAPYDLLDKQVSEQGREARNLPLLRENPLLQKRVAAQQL